MYKQHPNFIIDQTKELPLWRYMEFWKFLDLLNTSELYFSSVDELGDQHEGKIPENVINSWKAKLAINKIGKNIDDYIEDLKNSRDEVCTLSWIAKETESFPMWKMYAKEKLGVAIKTNHKSLKKSFEESVQTINIGEIRYYDFSDNKPNWGLSNIYFNFMAKPNYYETEGEVRCLFDLKLEKDKRKKVKVNLNELIKEVYISSFAVESGFLKVIEFLKKEYNLSFKIKVSGVNDKWI